jgi:hypothetical protein
MWPMRTWGVWMVLLAGLALAGPAQAMRCGNRVVGTGDYDFQVRERCGEPYWIQRDDEWLVQGLDGPYERRMQVTYETWYYNFGPRALVQRLRFRDGRLESIESAGYGVRRIGAECSDTVLSRGATLGEVYLHCGEPMSKTRRYEDIIQRDAHGNARVRTVRLEEWRYALPGSRFVRIAIFHDDRLDRVERVAR